MKKTGMPEAFAEVTGRDAVYRGPGADKTDSLIATSSEDARALVLRRTVWEARRIGGPVQLTTAGDHGEHRIEVSPDGTIAASAEGDDIDEFTGTFADADHSLEDEAVANLRRVPRIIPAAQRSQAENVRQAASQPRRTSFIESDAATQPTEGVPGLLKRLGVPIRPTAAQAQHTENIRATARHWGGCRTIAVVNGKGGVGKTMTSAMLAAVFARNGGGGVLAWDNNDTRGTLGWRTESGAHDATIQDALAAADELLAPGAAAADVAWYVHHQTQDRYDVLRSNPELLAAKQRIGQDQFDQLLKVATRYYRLVIFDSGNDESAERWLRMIDSAAQLVVPTLAAPESAESAALLLEALAARDDHSARLAREAVVIVTQSERGSAAEVKQVATAFEGLVRSVHQIPFDPGVKGGPLRFDHLRPTTQRAWTAAAAAVAADL
jgi:MinD-like ATPase involved in chromosome partitioning or flagellar assembly